MPQFVKSNLPEYQKSVNAAIENIIRNFNPQHLQLIVYSKNIIKLNSNYIRQMMLQHLGDDQKSQVFYSIKANDNPNLLKSIIENVNRFDIASGEELAYVESNFNISNINLIATGQAFTPTQISKVINYDGTFYFSSLSQIINFLALITIQRS